MTTDNQAEPPRQATNIAEEIALEIERLGYPRASYDLQPVDGVRRIIARRLTESFRDVPHFSLVTKIEVDALQAMRATLNRDDTPRVSLNDLIVRASALAIAQEPGVNVSFTERGMLKHRHADIAIAIATPSGLVTPIIREAETKSVRKIAETTKDFVARAAKRRLAPNEYAGGTFTISNLGMFGVVSFTSILNPPQACILSVGSVEKVQLFDRSAPRVASVMQVTLTCDHRAVDGATGAKWLSALKAIIETPSQLMD